MTSFVTAIGAAGLVALLARLVRAAPTTAADELAPAVRTALATAAPNLPTGFAAELVRAAADRRHESADGDAAGVALGYLFNGPQLPTAFLVSAARALRDVEGEAAAERGQDATAGDGAILWASPWTPLAASPLLDELRPDPDAPSLAAADAAFDPAYAILRQLGRRRCGRADAVRGPGHGSVLLRPAPRHRGPRTGGDRRRSSGRGHRRGRPGALARHGACRRCSSRRRS